MPGIAILGWGSLLWEGGSDFDRRHDDWQYDGPSLEIEFSRISGTREGALTLVIDSEFGCPMTVAWCLSKRQRVNETMEDLRLREGTSLEHIGDLIVSQHCRGHRSVAEFSIVTWAREKGLDAVIWTALERNFENRIKVPFSVDSAVSYIKGLGASPRAKAIEYVLRAPNFVQTPVRSALQRESWFGQTKK
jgi:hypothetical protein